jgi:hypothetical protein
MAGYVSAECYLTGIATMSRTIRLHAVAGW